MYSKGIVFIKQPLKLGVVYIDNSERSLVMFINSVVHFTPVKHPNLEAVGDIEG